MKPEIQLICDFMHYAFLPRLKPAQTKAKFYRDILTDPSVPTFDRTDHNSARQLIAKILGEKLKEKDASRVKLGVTAGYDSRGLLGAALDILKPEDIIAYTTGQQGNKDFERARYYTEDILPTHFLIGTQGGEYSTEDWIKRLSDRPLGFAGTMYGIKKEVESPLKQFKDLNSISGYFGDSASGKRLHGMHHTNWQDALEAFVHKNEVFRPPTKRLLRSLVPDDYNPMHMLPSKPLLPQHLMSYDDQLDMCYRQHQRIRLNFVPWTDAETRGHPTAAQKNKTIITVYDDPRWQKSYLSMPIEERYDQKHLKEMLAFNWPEIFRDLVTPDDPRFVSEPLPADPRERLEHSAKTALHTNWELLWTRNENFNRFARECITALAARNLIYWLDPIALLEEIDKDPLGQGKIIWCLVTVELNLRAGRLPTPATADVFKPFYMSQKSKGGSLLSRLKLKG